MHVTTCADDLLSSFSSYIFDWDQRFPFRPELWLKEDGSIPTRSWFIRHLQHLFPAEVGGHSLQAGGATALVEAGITSHLIQALGHWTSEAFSIHIRHSYMPPPCLTCSPCGWSPLFLCPDLIVCTIISSSSYFLTLCLYLYHMFPAYLTLFLFVMLLLYLPLY
jgi:hypothetical protein